LVLPDNLDVSRCALQLDRPVFGGIGLVDMVEAALRDYWVELRLHKACQLLKQTDEPVADVARQVGYSNVGNFSRAFRKRMRLTPTAFGRHGTNPLFR